MILAGGFGNVKGAVTRVEGKFELLVSYLVSQASDLVYYFEIFFISFNC